MWMATHPSWTTENNKATSTALKPENKQEEWVSPLTQAGVWDSWAWEVTVPSSGPAGTTWCWGSWAVGTGLGAWTQADEGIIFAFWRWTRKQAQIVSIWFLIFLDSGLWEDISDHGAKVLLVVLVWIKENRF